MTGKQQLVYDLRLVSDAVELLNSRITDGQISAFTLTSGSVIAYKQG